jgi:Ni/Co efflux regulator RcnB
MQPRKLAILAAAGVLALSSAIALAQDRGEQGHTRFDDHDQQVTREWYNQHRDHPPTGFRKEDRLSADEEARLREGTVLDRNLRRKIHSAPHDLTRQLPPPPRRHRYVAIGGHVALIDNRNEVKAVIHLHDQ